MPFIDPTDLPVKEPRPGWQGRFFHSERMTFSYYDLAAGAEVHEHHHPQEEVFHVLAGALELTVDGERRVVTAGQAAVVPPDVPHSARVAADPCRVIVVDCPGRDHVGGIDLR